MSNTKDNYAGHTAHLQRIMGDLGAIDYASGTRKVLYDPEQRRFEGTPTIPPRSLYRHADDWIKGYLTGLATGSGIGALIFIAWVL